MTMRIKVPTPFTDDLLDALAPDAARITLYGQRPGEPLGGGRAALFLPDPGAEAFAAHLARAKKLGFRFAYLFNAPCTGGVEATAEGGRAFRGRVAELADLGVDEITVAAPILAEIIKKVAPGVTVNAGLFARVTTVAAARRWVEAGAGKITLFLDLNRDFAGIRRMRAAVPVPLELVATLTCLQGCAASPHCANLLAHAAREGGAPALAHTVTGCTLEKLEHPAELIRSGWIRPEDLPHYAAAGIAEVKITERTDPAERLVLKARAYLAGRFDGNLFDLLTFALRRPAPLAAGAAKRRLDKGGMLAQARLLRGLSAPPEPFLDNRALDGFLAPFLDGRCDGRCAGCGHCDAHAARIAIGSGAAAIAALREIRDGLVKGTAEPEAQD